MINFIKNIFNGKKEKLLTKNVNENLNHTIHLGITPSSEFGNGKDHYQILSINYSVLQGEMGLVTVVLNQGLRVRTIKVTTQDAVNTGFINPYGLNKYCTL